MDSFSLLLHLALIIGTASASTDENESHATMQKDIPDELGTAFRTIEASEMQRVLRETIEYLKLTYLRLDDHPDQAREVRIAAIQFKILQLLASDLINEFGVTAAHIEEMMKQILVDPVKMNMKDEELVKDALHQNIEEAGNMKKETETTRDNYIELKDKLIEIMANVTSREKHIVDEKKRIRVEMENEKVQLKAAYLAQEELNEERRRLDDELEMLKSGTAGQNMTGRSEMFFQRMAPGTAFIRGRFGYYSVILSFTDASSQNIRIKEDNLSMDAYTEAQLERAYGQKRIIHRLHEQQKLALEKLAELKKLGKKIANFGDVHSLNYAIDNLGVVEVQLTRIMQFWSHMASVLEELKSNMKTVILYLKKEDPEHRDRFFAGINGTIKGWSDFRNICASYVKETD